MSWQFYQHRLINIILLQKLFESKTLGQQTAYVHALTLEINQQHSVLYCFCLYNPNKRLFSFVKYASYSDKSSEQLTMAATLNQKCLRRHVRLICLIKDSICNKIKGHFYRVFTSRRRTSGLTEADHQSYFAFTSSADFSERLS